MVITNIEDISIANSGVKAYFLSKYKLFTPDFVVLTTEFYKLYKNIGINIFHERNSDITVLAKYFQVKGINEVIIRSSCTDEGINDRGKYLSLKSETSVTKIKETIIKIFEDFKLGTTNESSIALIFQVYIKPKIQGHLSNERRISKDKKVWLIESEFEYNNDIRTERINAKDEIGALDYSITHCLSAKILQKNLKKFASYLSILPERYHCEWLWDGSNFWIVQLDIEMEISNTKKKPGSNWLEENEIKQNSYKLFSDLEVFETVKTTRTKSHKIDCVKKFYECGLPYWEIYILENAPILKMLTTNDVDISLKSDLKKLLSVPIIIRTDIFNEQKYLLPRTETLYTYEDAEKFLIENTKKFVENGLECDQFCFLIHHFISSVAGALCFCKPSIGKAIIDSNWGIVEGLYYYPYDSFEIDQSQKITQKKIRCKQKYIDVGVDGKWQTVIAGPNYDWKQSLSNYQIIEISRMTQRIADVVGKSLTVMFFINDKRYYPEVLPWYYSIDEVPEIETNYTNVIFLEKKEILKTKSDFERIKESNYKGGKRTILIRLNIEICRDKEFVEEVADYARQEGIAIHIEGSILSHPYYVFSSKGVDVKCIDPLEPTRNQREFYKLVRDKIPVIISDNHENAIISKVSSQELIYLLKEKAVEEAMEFYWSKGNDASIEELVDLFEVILGACKAYGIEFSEIENIAKIKRDKRGGFEEGVVLVATQENSLFQLQKRKKDLFNSKDNFSQEKKDIKLRPVSSLFQKGEIKNFKSLTEVERIQLAYINNFAHQLSKFRYILKAGEYNSVEIEYKEKGITISFDNVDISSNPQQLKIL